MKTESTTFLSLFSACPIQADSVILLLAGPTYTWAASPRNYSHSSQPNFLLLILVLTYY